MHAKSSFDYALIRIVPRVEWEEFINAGVIVFCPEKQFLSVRIHINEARLRALWPELDLHSVKNRLTAFSRVSAADPSAGPIARLNQRQRFHWLVAPRSTVVQVSPVHTGLCESPEQVLDELFGRLFPGSSGI
jgi:Protein of unknown function (DUF3037)